MILHRDNDWLAVDKPTGLATHAGQPGELGAVEWLALHRDEDVHVVSRLDRGTSGVLLLARHPAASARAGEIHTAGTAVKTYQFLSATDSVGRGLGETWTCDDPLDGKTAHTVFRRIEPARNGRLWLYEAEITRGRRHQIRRHAAAAGLPLLGDADYGLPDFPRLALHCREVRWPGLTAPLVSPCPESFAAALKGVGLDEIRLHACLEARGNWPASVTDAWRVVHRDEIPDLPAAIDLYGDACVCSWFGDPEADLSRLEDIARLVRHRYRSRFMIERRHRRDPHQEGLIDGIIGGGSGDPEGRQKVHEHGLQYEITFFTTQHLGLFLDQRDTRRRLMQRARGARMANLFAYTCSFSVAAAAAEAEVVFSVDTARACLQTGMRNFALNGLQETGRGKFIQEDARRWLARQERKRDASPAAWQGLDLVVCDPPVFAAFGKAAPFSVEKEWPALARSCAGLLAPGGTAVFANNHRTGDHVLYRKALEAAFGEVVDLRPPLDFPVLPGRPHHVRTFWCADPR